MRLNILSRLPLILCLRLLQFEAANEKSISTGEKLLIKLAREHVESCKSSRLFVWLMVGTYSNI